MATRLLQVTLLFGLVGSLALAAWQITHAVDTAGWLFWLVWPAMVIHQCEEHLFTEALLGPRYRFCDWVRSVGYDVSPWRAFGLNIGVGWTLAIAVGLVGTRFIWFSLFVIGVEMVNALWHLTMTLRRRDWSPGSLSSACLTLPLGASIFVWSRMQGFIHPLGLIATFELIATFAVSIFAHYLFLSSLPKVPMNSTVPASE